MKTYFSRDIFRVYFDVVFDVKKGKNLLIPRTPRSITGQKFTPDWDTVVGYVNNIK